MKKSGLLLAASTLPFSSFMIPQSKEKLGVALVGLGYYSRDLLAPALQLTRHCELKGIVTGTPAKIPVWKKIYGIADKNVYNYGNMHEMADNEDIDIVYIYGYGFPAWRGGPMHYADAVGLDKVLARIQEFRERFGEENWTPAPLLEKLVADGRSLKDWAARQ